jgi:molybdate transport system substrate-binding protein
MFRRAFCAIVVGAIASAISFGSGATGFPAPDFAAVPDQGLTVSAAISMKASLDEVVQLYSTEHPGSNTRVNLGASGTLERQIEQGAPVDVFISASPKEMDALESQALLRAGTRRNVVRNSVVLIVPAGSSGISSFQDLTKPAVKVIAIGEPQTVPAGEYAKEILTHIGIYDRVKPKLVLAKDVRQVLTYLETGNADAGIVYATDARASKKVSVVSIAPEDSHSPVIYPAAVIKTSKNSEAAKTFLDFLGGSKAQAIFQKYGFVRAGN